MSKTSSTMIDAMNAARDAAQQPAQEFLPEEQPSYRTIHQRIASQQAKTQNHLALLKDLAYYAVALSKAFNKLTESWEQCQSAGIDLDFMNNDYPFNQSFDEQAAEVGQWLDSTGIFDHARDNHLLY